MVAVATNAVIVDLDGTVWDSAPWYAEITAGRTPLSPVAKALRDKGVSHASFAERTRREVAPLYDGIADALNVLDASGVLLGVATNLPGWVAKPMLSAHGLDGLFRAVVCYEDTRRHKPAPEPLIRCATLLRLKPESCVYVGDDVKDAVAAHAAGMRFLWAAWGYGDPDASQVVHTPGELADDVIGGR